MSGIPAVCNKCNTIFPTHIFDGITIIGTLTINNVSVGPCPKCGSKGSIPDGVYKSIKGLINELTNNKYTDNELLNLKEVLKNSQKEGNKNIKEKIEEEAPEFSGIAKYLPQTREERINYTFFIITAILTILSMLQNSGNGTTVNVEQVINHMYVSEEKQQINQTESEFKYTVDTLKKESNKNKSITVKKIGRNEICPCGSGMKYKRCHGK